MTELNQLIKKDIAERELIKEGIRRVKIRQSIIILIGVLITIMFALNYIELRKQITQDNEIKTMLNQIIEASVTVIRSQDESITVRDSLLQDLLYTDTLPQK